MAEASGADVLPPQAHLRRDGVREQKEGAVSHSSGREAVTCVGNNLLRNHSNTHVAALGSGLAPDQTFIKQPHKLWSPEEQYQTDQMLMASICSSSQNSRPIPLSPQTAFLLLSLSCKRTLPPPQSLSSRPEPWSTGDLEYRDGRQVKPGDP